jgi:hypothetical protein
VIPFVNILWHPIILIVDESYAINVELFPPPGAINGKTFEVGYFH